MKRLLFLVLLFVPLVFTTCFDNGDGNTKTTDEVIIKPQVFSSYLHFEFVDAKTGTPLRGKEVSLTIKGKDAAQVYNNLGLKESKYTTKVGYYDFMIDVTKVTGDFVISTSCAGYEDHVQRIRLQGAKFSAVQAKLLKISDLPDGILVAPPTSFTTNAQGQTTSEIIINTNVSNKVRIPQGVILKDVNGKIVSGKIDAKVLFFTPNESVEFFPGGMNVEITNANGQNQEVAFISAGLFDIQLTSGNTPVRIIEGGGFEVTSVLNSALVNPTTGNPVLEGDEIQLWSMDPETTVWQFEKNAIIKKNAAGQLYLSEEINHLSSWNWDWTTNYCYEGLTIQFQGNARGDMIKVVNRSPINYYSSSTTVRVDVNDSYYNKLTFYYVPRNMNTILSFESTSPGVVIQPPTIVIPDLCASRTYPVTVISTDPNYTVNIDVDVRSKSNPNARVIINGWAYLYSYADYSSRSLYVNEGKVSATVRAGGDYYFDVSLGNSFGYGYLRIDDMPNNKVKITFSPEYASYYVNWFDYGSVNVPKQEIIMDKPANKVINISTKYFVDDALLNIF